jgi:para-nitrobenzyl esterase
MKKIILFFLFLSSTLSVFSQATVGCDGLRYNLDIFPDTTMTTVKYGRNTPLGGVATDLFMDVVQPKGDVQTKRPVIVWAFGGGFVQGARADMRSFCQIFAKKGYVCVTIDYRLYNIATQGIPDSTKITPAIIQAIHDMKAAVRFLYKDAKTTNTFKVDTNNIIVGGVSAGAITAMATAQMDSTDKIETWVKNIITAQGGFEGNSGNEGYSVKTKGAISGSGALYRKEWLDKDDVPFISYHGTADDVVAYGYGKNVYSFYGDGGGTLYPEARRLGIPSVLVTVPGGGHAEIYNTNSKYLLNFLDFLNRTVIFSKSLVCGEPIVSLATKVEDIDYQQVSLYPNPSSGDMTLEMGKNTEGGYRIAVYDLVGREVFNSGKQDAPQYTFKQNSIGKGMFIAKVIFDNKQSVLTKKIVFE